jgi:FkbM family methyltransferase
VTRDGTQLQNTPYPLYEILSRGCQWIDRPGDLFDRLVGTTANELILFGAGPLGRSTLRGLQTIGIKPVGFSDNNPKLWNQRVDGIEVLPPDEAVDKYGSRAAFVVTIYNGSSARNQLQNLGCRTVVPFAALFWRYSAAFIPKSGLGLPRDILECRSEIEACNAILADDLSRRELCEQIVWRCTLDYTELSPHSNFAQMHFDPSVFLPMKDEVLVDCGAFDGDSVRSFLEQRHGQFSRIFALEPDPSNRAALGKAREVLPSGIRERMVISPYAVGNCSGRVGFRATGDVASEVEEIADQTVELRTLDALISEWHVAPTHIKLDIEGSEPDALDGATDTLNKHMPVLSVCLYHRCEHLWQIPLLIKRLMPDYKLFIRRYAEECWELVCYAVPVSRLTAGQDCT